MMIMNLHKLLKSWLLGLLSTIRQDNSPRVVFYHDIGISYTPMGTPVELFKAHLEILSQHSALGTNHLICFDDGFRGAWDYRELLPRGVKVFIAVDLVGKPGYLTWEEMRILKKDHGVDFQSHTWSHQTLIGPRNDEVLRAERTEEWYERELIASREKIAKELGKVVDELCFPVGYFSDEVIARCKAAGYKKVYASYPGNLGEGYVQPRCLVQDLSPMAFKAVLKGGMNRLAERYRQRHYIGK